MGMYLTLRGDNLMGLVVTRGSICNSTSGSQLFVPQILPCCRGSLLLGRYPELGYEVWKLKEGRWKGRRLTRKIKGKYPSTKTRFHKQLIATSNPKMEIARFMTLEAR